MIYKSKLERDFALELNRVGIKYKYEEDKIPYVRPSSYTPDWKVGKNKYLETKGEFTPAQRNNLLAFREQHPNIEIVMVFAQAENKLNKKSKMTYAQWCKRHGIKYHNLRAVYTGKGYVFKNPIPKEGL